MESFILQNENDNTSVDTSNFFAYYRFPKLQRLKLINCTISSWDLMSRIAGLTTLDLDVNYLSPTPTISQLLPILASNPTLQKVSLSGWQEVSADGGGGENPSPLVPLHHLKEQSGWRSARCLRASPSVGPSQKHG
jgi:hypothetical protein